MIQQERDLLTNLITRLRQSQPQQRDPEAEAMIGDLVREKPDTPYLLAQTVLIQDYALHQAQARVAELERQLQAQPPAQEGGGFLSAIFGSGKPPQRAPQVQPAAAPPFTAQPGYAQQAPAAGPWGAAPQPGPQPSFLRSAATTAAGIAGGALLFQGIESLLGGRGGFGGFGGYGAAGYGAAFTPQPGITETVVNNYYGDAPQGTQQADYQDADYQQADYGDGGFADANYDDNGGFDGGGDFGGDDSI